MNGMPVFIKIEDYRKVLEITEQVKVKIEDAKTMIAKIDELKAQEDAEIMDWKARLDTITEKVGYIDGVLTSPTDE